MVVRREKRMGRAMMSGFSAVRRITFMIVSSLKPSLGRKPVCIGMVVGYVLWGYA